jgi:Targeting protein for Xklp2 (TPX2) domain
VEQAARAANILAIREEARQEKLAQEELERRELATFKAKPIPRTTYEYNSVVPAPTVSLVEPFSPELQTKQRMKERKAFDEYAEQERLAKMEREQAMEDARRADEDEEIKERRRLPVSEGGMIPVAGPINVVL